jgi:hypothetical protein
MRVSNSTVEEERDCVKELQETRALQTISSFNPIYTYTYRPPTSTLESIAEASDDDG